MFYTGTEDNGDPSSWSPTAHVLVAGGIVPSGDGGQYMATDTVDILREDGIDTVTGEVWYHCRPMWLVFGCFMSRMYHISHIACMMPFFEGGEQKEEEKRAVDRRRWQSRWNGVRG